MSIIKLTIAVLLTAGAGFAADFPGADTNEIGSYYEGPVPQNCIIRDNVFRNTQGVPIVVGSQRASSPAAYAKNIRITGNSIEGLFTPCIRAFSVSGLTISGNNLSLSSSVSPSVPLSLAHIVNETISDNPLSSSIANGEQCRAISSWPTIT